MKMATGIIQSKKQELKRLLSVNKKVLPGFLVIGFCLFGCGSEEISDFENWSRFRGPNGQGISRTENLPAEFGPDKNVIWKTKLPLGHSSPVLSRSRIFLTAFENENLITYCLDRQTGEILWQKGISRPRAEKLFTHNVPAAASAVTDGKNVFVFFGDFGLISYDLEGNELWELPMGPFDNFYGMGASPILFEDKLIIVCDQSTDSFIMALSKESGEVIWKTDRPEAKSGHSTPVLYRSDEGTQVIVPGSFYLTGYSAETGEKLWWVRGLSFEIKSIPAISDGIAYINGYATPSNQPGHLIELPPFEEVLPVQDADKNGTLSRDEMPSAPTRSLFSFVDHNSDSQLNADEWSFLRGAMAVTNGMLAIRVGGKGDMTDSNLLWQYHRSVPQLPSPLVYDNVLYMVNDGGIVTSFDPKTGDIIKRGRLKGAIDKYFASPVAADDKIYMVSHTGKVAVVSPDGNLEVLAVNDMDELCYATPAIDDGRIYLRTASTLYCFGLQ